MAEIIPFAPREIAVEPEPYAFDRARFRAQTEAAIHALLDLAHAAMAVLDRLDGDPDFEPDAESEDDGIAEPMMAALVTVSGLRWCGFDGGAA